MPISYAIDVKQRYVYTTVSGTLNLNEVLNHKRDLAADPAFVVDMPELADARQLESVEFPESDLAVVAQQGMMLAPRLGANHKVAVVLGKEEFFDLARGFEQIALKAGQDVAIFRDLEAALDWLDIR